jgi:EamA domain-containing membrane protein RarD
MRNLFIAYYIICVVYCVYQLRKRYIKSGTYYGFVPELDMLMVIMMAWVLAPIDIVITWVRLAKNLYNDNKTTNV